MTPGSRGVRPGRSWERRRIPVSLTSGVSRDIYHVWEGVSHFSDYKSTQCVSE